MPRTPGSRSPRSAGIKFSPPSSSPSSSSRSISATCAARPRTSAFAIITGGSWAWPTKRAISRGCNRKELQMSEIQALVHDVFGTVVDWRSAVSADGEALGARKGITGVDWQQFADEWRGAYAPSMNRVRTGELPWTNLDALHRMGLDSLLDKFGIASKLSEEDKVWFNLTWHRLKPWPDSVPGLTRIQRQYIIAAQ